MTFSKVIVFPVFAKRLNSIRSNVKELQTTKCRFFRKENCFFILNHQKCTFRHQIAPKPAKRVLRTMLLLENIMETKLKIQKIMDFSIFIPPDTVEISCFQKKIRGKGVMAHLSVNIR